MAEGRSIETTAGIILTLCCLCGQYLTLQLICGVSTLRKDNILQIIERNKNVARAVNNEAVSSIFTRLTIRPNSYMI